MKARWGSVKEKLSAYISLLSLESTMRTIRLKSQSIKWIANKVLHYINILWECFFHTIEDNIWIYIWKDFKNGKLILASQQWYQYLAWTLFSSHANDINTEYGPMKHQFRFTHKSTVLVLDSKEIYFKEKTIIFQNIALKISLLYSINFYLYFNPFLFSNSHSALHCFSKFCLEILE